MLNLDKDRERILNGWMRTYLDMEYILTEESFKTLLRREGLRLSRIYRAMLRPVELGETSQKVLDIYEEQFANVMTVHGGFFIEC